jgi:hypothetical protein
MASVSNEQGRRAIQFIGTDEKRHSIRLGKCDQRTAEGVKLHVERLAGATKTGMPIHVDTVNWLASIGDDLHARIARSGLTTPRQTAASGILTLAKMIDAYIDRRKADMKPWSITTLKQARDKLVSFFGAEKPVLAITAILQGCSGRRTTGQKSIRQDQGRLAKEPATAAVYQPDRDRQSH